jgi:L-fuculose-phosphate aldolase
MRNTKDREKRQSIIDACRSMNALGINQGTSGNISLRHGEGLLITPTSTPYEAMQPEQIVFMRMDGSHNAAQQPSTEWRFHLDILKARPEINAVVHAHPPYSTILAIMGLEIPPIHYMIACAGGDTIRVAPYATFGTQELSEHAVRALEGRLACLLEHHGRLRSAHRFRKRCGLPSKSKRWPDNITAACRLGRRDCCRRRRSKTFSAGSQDTVLPTNNVRPISRRSPLRSSARR